MPRLPIEHLSASSINLHMKCARQWQQKYVLGVREPSNSSLIIGSAVHLYLSWLFQEIPEPDGRLNVRFTFQDAWEKSVDEAGEGIVWKDDPVKARGIAEAHVYHYWESVGKYLKVLKAEQEISIMVPGVDIPVIGFVDAECADRIIDFKTTAQRQTSGMFSPVKKVNQEWKFQIGIYQLAVPKPGEMHVLTRAKVDPIIVPDSTSHPLYYGMVDTDKVQDTIRHQWNAMNYNYETYGAEKPWPGNPLHEYAGKYCQVERCCSL